MDEGRRGWMLAFLLPALTGCAVVPGAAGSGSGTLIAGTRLALSADAPDAGPTDALIRRVLAAQLNAKGFVVTADAPSKLHFGLARRDIGIRFGAGEGAKGDAVVATGEAPAYRGNDVLLCRAETVRLSVAIHSSGASIPAFSSAAEDVVCGTLSAGKIALLVDTALSPLGSR